MARNLLPSLVVLAVDPSVHTITIGNKCNRREVSIIEGTVFVILDTRGLFRTLLDNIGSLH